MKRAKRVDPMRCATCGENVQAGSDRCPTCGAVQVVRERRPVAHPGLKQCPRCLYRGDGVPYFRKAGHVGLLVGLSVFTYGIGGLVYYSMRRRHTVCPSCGLGWEHARDPGEAFSGGAAVAPAPRRRSLGTPVPASALPPSGVGRRVFGAGAALLGTVLVVAGVLGRVPEPFVVGSLLGMAGSGTFLWGWRALQERRRAVLQDLSRKVLALADQRGGVVTVTEVATELDLTLPAAEKVLVGMDDGLRVRSEVSREGVLYYEFPELRHRKAIRSGGAV